MSKTVILIPAYNPCERLVFLVNDLVSRGVSVVVVDDGSDEFVNLRGGVPVLTHEKNLGKGAALKTGMRYISENFPEYDIVTADADGQHLPDDIFRLAENDKDGITLGVRDFGGAPTRNKIGNKLTSIVMGTLFGLRLRDTQTGLRKFHHGILPQLLEIPGIRFEYETNMLMWAVKSKTPLHQEPIATVYIDQGRASSFRPLVDGVRIYWQFFKFVISSIASGVIDLGICSLLLILGVDAITATIAARVVSSIVNFFVNRSIVFKNRDKHSVVKYYLLAAAIMCVSAGALKGLELLGLPPAALTGCKAIVDTLLFFVSFRVQNRWVF